MKARLRRSDTAAGAVSPAFSSAAVKAGAAVIVISCFPPNRRGRSYRHRAAAAIAAARAVRLFSSARAKIVLYPQLEAERPMNDPANRDMRPVGARR
jgi:hypothetical protein